MAKKGYDFTIQSDEAYNADKAVREFCKKHPGELAEEEHRELRRLLNNRAEAFSNALGTKIHSICED